MLKCHICENMIEYLETSARMIWEKASIEGRSKTFVPTRQLQLVELWQISYPLLANSLVWCFFTNSTASESWETHLFSRNRSMFQEANVTQINHLSWWVFVGNASLILRHTHFYSWCSHFLGRNLEDLNGKLPKYSWNHETLRVFLDSFSFRLSYISNLAEKTFRRSEGQQIALLFRVVPGGDRN